MDASTATVITAAIAAGPLYWTTWRASKRSRSTEAKVDNLHADMATNHGRRPGEYLEMLPMVIDSQLRFDRRLTEHTEQDAVNFARISDRLNDLAEGVE